MCLFAIEMAPPQLAIMNAPPFTRRFFESTRGKIILLLRQDARTVAELAQKLELTDNAIRAHLATLERDGLARQKGERQGFRKPHLSYELTAEAEELFPKAYAPVLNTLLMAIKERDGSSALEGLLRNVGRRLAVSPPATAGSDSSDPVDRAVTMLQNLGGNVRIERTNGHVTLCGAGCPLSGVTADHEEVCDMVEALLRELLGIPVTQVCERSAMPRCRFEINAPNDAGESRPKTE